MIKYVLDQRKLERTNQTSSSTRSLLLFFDSNGIVFFFVPPGRAVNRDFFFFYTRVLERLRKNNETRQITHFTQTLERFTVTTPAVIRPSSSTSFRPEKNGFCNRPDLGKCNDLSFLFHTRKYSSDFGVPQKSIKGA